MVKTLLSHGVDLNATANDGYTALHNAALKGRQDIVSLLLSHGARLDDRTMKGKHSSSSSSSSSSGGGGSSIINTPWE